MKTKRQSNMIKSPCVSRCEMDEETGWCLGCRRTVEEIAGWGSATERKKRHILKCIEKRPAQR